MTTLPIPLITYPTGSTTFGPAALPNGIASVLVTLDRTAGAASWNSQPATTTLHMDIEISLDSGVTWAPVFALSVAGGVYTNILTHTPFVAQTLWCTLPLVTGRQIRGTVTLTGAAVTFSGTVVF